MYHVAWCPWSENADSLNIRVNTPRATKSVSTNSDKPHTEIELLTLQHLCPLFYFQCSTIVGLKRGQGDTGRQSGTSRRQKKTLVAQKENTLGKDDRWFTKSPKQRNGVYMIVKLIYWECSRQYIGVLWFESELVLKISISSCSVGRVAVSQRLEGE